MRRFGGLLLLMAVFVFTGCYHATVDTGLRPSGEVIEEDWAHGFVYGLVPPSDIEVASDCPGGVAQVETKLSFLNQLASALTWGIYTPMTIRVHCAAGPDRTGMNEANTFEVSAEDHDVETVDRALRMAIATGAKTYLKFVAAD